MDHSGVPVLKPPVGLPQRPFDLPFHGVDLIASHPLLPLQLRIIETPALGSRPICRLPLLELGIISSHLGLARVCRGCIGSAVAPEILHTTDPRCSRSHPTITIPLRLHPSITPRFRSEIFHGWPRLMDLLLPVSIICTTLYLLMGVWSLDHGGASN